MLALGTIAPDFECTDDLGQSILLQELLEDGPIILYFYPGDFTPVCTKQACAFRDRSSELEGSGVRIFGVSSDNERKHARFREQYSLPFQLLCDSDGRMAKAYRVSGAFGFLPGRVSYLISAEAVIQARASASIRLGPHLDFIEEVLTFYPLK